MANSVIEQRVFAVIRTVLALKDTQPETIAPEMALYQDGLGLDSLDAATLSAALEQEFGADPYTAGRFPQTVQEIIKFYQPVG